jgi:hypothetical protein
MTNPDVHIEESTNEKPQLEIVESPEGVQEPEHTQSDDNLFWRRKCKFFPIDVSVVPEKAIEGIHSVPEWR